MKTSICLTIALCVCCGLHSPAAGQDGTETQVTLSHPGFSSFYKDLGDILNLCTDEEAKQFKEITGFVDGFSSGLHQQQPIRGVFPVNVTPFSFIAELPLDETNPVFENFRDNLDGVGYPLERDSVDKTFYFNSTDPEFIWVKLNAEARTILLQYCDDDATAKAKAAGISVEKYTRQLLQDLKKTLAATPSPSIAISGNMAAEIVNTNHSPEALKSRHDAFAVSRKQSMDAIVRRPEESPTEFALRSRVTSNLLDEFERVLAEVTKVSAVLTLNAADPAALTTTVNTSLKAIDGSSLAGSIALFGTQPDAFASVPKAEGSALSLRVNHPIDPMRQANVLEILALTEKDMAARLAGSTQLSPDEQAATLKVTQGVLEVVADSVRTGFINSFVEAVPDGQGDFVSVSAFATPTAMKLNDVLPGLATGGKGNLVETAIDSECGVTIHRVQLATGYSDFMDKAFGEKKDIFVGVSATHVWLASGPGSKERLKATIAALGSPAENSSPLHVELKLLPWVQKADRLAKLKPEGKTSEEKELQREVARKRARAIEAFADNDDVVADFQVHDGDVIGELKFGTGFLRMIGKEMAAFSKTNFE